MNKTTKIISLGTVTISIVFLISLVINPYPETIDKVTVDELLEDYFSSHIIKKENNLDFDTYFTENDIIRIEQKIPIQDEVRFELSAEKSELYEKTKTK